MEFVATRAPPMSVLLYVHLTIAGLGVMNVVVGIMVHAAMEVRRARCALCALVAYSGFAEDILYRGKTCTQYQERLRLMSPLQSTQKLKADLAKPTIRRFLIHYFEL